MYKRQRSYTTLLILLLSEAFTQLKIHGNVFFGPGFDPDPARRALQTSGWLERQMPLTFSTPARCLLRLNSQRLWRLDSRRLDTLPCSTHCYFCIIVCICLFVCFFKLFAVDFIRRRKMNILLKVGACVKIRVRLAEKAGGRMAGKWVPTGGVVWREFFEFSSKKCTVLCSFIAKNYTCGQKPGPGGLIDPLGAENVKSTRG